MSILVRAAVLGGLAYVVSRAVKASRASQNPYDTQRLRRSDEAGESETWPSSEEPSISTPYGSSVTG